MTEAVSAIMVLAFGGPESMDEVRPFLARVLAGRPVPPERIEEVVHHYERIGGRSPGPEITKQQAAALRAQLVTAGCTLPVHIAFRCSEPYIADVLAQLASDGHRELLGLVMAAHESDASHGRYHQAMEKARAALGARAPRVRYTAAFHEHPGFVAAHVEHVQRALAQLPEAPRAQAPIVFTAHSIPVNVAHTYVAQLEASARLVCEALGRPLDGRSVRIAYQSRSGSPRDPWLEPDICDVLPELAAQGIRNVVVAPLGFLCDHVEVLYDLDVEALELAQSLDMQLARAGAPGTHPAFIEALRDAVLAATTAPR
jgi:ferrochelatase